MHEPDGRHLSDEQLSAYLDEEEAQGPLDALDLEAHLASCARCSDRIGALREVGILVATPVEPVSPEVRAAAVAAAVHPGVDEAEVLERFAHTKPERLRQRRLVVAGALAAAAVILAVALPLTLSGNSSPTSVAARHGSARSSPTNGKKNASGSAIPSAGSSAVVPATTATLLDLGAVSSLEQVDRRLQEAGVSGASPAAAAPLFRAGERPAISRGCVEDTRRAAHGGAFGPGVVASATYRGSRVLVMEFWAMASAPPAGETVVALSAEDGCRLVARGTT
jgi:hypothetical protein